MLSGIRDFNALTDKLGDNNGYALLRNRNVAGFIFSASVTFPTA